MASRRAPLPVRRIHGPPHQATRKLGGASHTRTAQGIVSNGPLATSTVKVIHTAPCDLTDGRYDHTTPAGEVDLVSRGASVSADKGRFLWRGAGWAVARNARKALEPPRRGCGRPRGWKRSVRCGCRRPRIRGWSGSRGWWPTRWGYR